MRSVGEVLINGTLSNSNVVAVGEALVEIGVLCH